MDIFVFIAIIAPVLAIAAWVKAARHTRIVHHNRPLPTALVVSFMNINENQSWHLK